MPTLTICALPGAVRVLEPYVRFHDLSIAEIGLQEGSLREAPVCYAALEDEPYRQISHISNLVPFLIFMHYSTSRKASQTD